MSTLGWPDQVSSLVLRRTAGVRGALVNYSGACTRVIAVPTYRHHSSGDGACADGLDHVFYEPIGTVENQVLYEPGGCLS